MTDDGDLRGGTFAEIGNAAGVTTTLASTTLTKKCNWAGDVVGGASTLFALVGATGWWNQDAGTSFASNLSVANSNGHAPGTDIVIQNKTLTMSYSVVEIAETEMDANINTTGGALIIYNATDGRIVTLNMNGYSLQCGQLKLGHSTAAKTGSGIVYLGSGTHSLASVIMWHDANTQNALHLDSGSIFLTNTLDGNSEDTNPMEITSVGANLIGGTLLDTAVDGILHSWGVTSTGVVPINVVHEGSSAGAALGNGLSLVGV